MPSDHFQDFAPEVVEPEPPTPEVQAALDAASSDSQPEPPAEPVQQNG